MKVITSLNRISLSLLLEQGLTWEERGNQQILRDTNKITLNGKIIELTREITKTNGDIEDIYYFDSTLQNNVGHVILTHELRLGLPHNEQTLTELYTPSELKEFVALNEDSRDCFVTHWIGEHSLDDAIVKYADNIFKSAEKDSVKSLE